MRWTSVHITESTKDKLVKFCKPDKKLGQVADQAILSFLKRQDKRYRKVSGEGQNGI